MTDYIICSISTPKGEGAISIVRASGKGSIELCEKIFIPANSNIQLSTVKRNSIVFGKINSPKIGIIDEVLVSVFHGPYSFTGEDTIEISCHGSTFIQKEILNLLIQTGAVPAKPGEFSQRAFLNGKIDLSQAEAISDLISSKSKASHKVAMNQMKGGFSNDLSFLRSKLLHFTSLIELELDFSEEDVEFANRKDLANLINEISEKVDFLTNSFQYGNVIKNGIPVAIVGEPNVGKSTLLNRLLNDEKALVSDIPGTTRDAIEDTAIIEGIMFRFIDTAGIRTTSDIIENLGIDRTFQKIDKAEIVLLLIDINDKNYLEKIENIKQLTINKNLMVVFNKSDIFTTNVSDKNSNEYPGSISISAKTGENFDRLILKLTESVKKYSESENTIITNARHYNIMLKVKSSLTRIKLNLSQSVSGEFLSQDIREILNYFGEITGEFTTDEVLGNIFKNFCIGK